MKNLYLKKITSCPFKTDTKDKGIYQFVPSPDMLFILAESLLGKLSASFDQKMRFLLDPDYRGVVDERGPDSHQKSAASCLFENSTKKELDDVKNALLRDKANKKVELKRVNRVDRNSEPEMRKGLRHDPALRQVNSRRPLKRSDSLTKKEKTELNQKTKEVEKENKVMKLKEHFEQGGINRPRANHLASAAIPASAAAKFDVNKVRKKLSDSRNRRIKRRHTVGGTKDFTENLMSKMNADKSKSSWDRLAPIVSQPELTMPATKTASDIWSLEKEERRLSLPDCGVSRPVESHV